jgi:hypothetical protein
MSQRNGDGRIDATSGSEAAGLSENRETLLNVEANGSAVAEALTTRTASLAGTALATATGLAADTTQATGQVTGMTLLSKINFSAVASSAFDRWLARELRVISAALAQPVPQKLRDVIEGHRKITK